MAVFAGAFFSASQWSEPLRTRSFRRSRRSSRALHSLSLLWRRLPTSQFCHASRATHEAGSSSDAWHSSIRSPPITTPRSVEHSIGTLPSPTESPCRSLKTKELIPPPDGGPEPLTDTPTPYGIRKPLLLSPFIVLESSESYPQITLGAHLPSKERDLREAY